MPANLENSVVATEFEKVIFHSNLKERQCQECSSESEVAQSCQTLCDPKDGNLPGSEVHGIFQARILEWAAISFSRGSSQPRDRTRVSCIADRSFTIWATREAQECSNYRTIALGSHTSKVMLKILQARLQQYLNHELPDGLAGFRESWRTRDQIANIHWVIKKSKRIPENIYICFIDYAKTFDCVAHNKLWKIL